MNMVGKFKYVLIAFAMALGLLVLYGPASADDQSTEKCYGIAKAGMNDCDSNAPACDKSVIDADPNYFMMVPKGMCNKIVGGMTIVPTGLHPGAGISNLPPVPPTPAAPGAPTTTPAATPAAPVAPTTTPTTPATPSTTPSGASMDAAGTTTSTPPKQ